MKYLLIIFTLMFVVVYATTLRAEDEADTTITEPTATSIESAESPRVYPIAPGVWYPGEPLPEKPMRYYRVRCWPGCHHGSSYGKYPDEPLNMKPIFPTRTIDYCPPLETDVK